MTKVTDVVRVTALPNAKQHARRYAKWLALCSSVLWYRGRQRGVRKRWMARSPLLCARCGAGIRSGFPQSGKFTYGFFRRSPRSGKDILMGQAALRGGLAQDAPMNGAVRGRLNAKRLCCGADELLSRNVAHVLC